MKALTRALRLRSRCALSAPPFRERAVHVNQPSVKNIHGGRRKGRCPSGSTRSTIQWYTFNNISGTRSTTPMVQKPCLCWTIGFTRMNNKNSNQKKSIRSLRFFFSYLKDMQYYWTFGPRDKKGYLGNVRSSNLGADRDHNRCGRRRQAASIKQRGQGTGWRAAFAVGSIGLTEAEGWGRGRGRLGPSAPV